MRRTLFVVVALLAAVVLAAGPAAAVSEDFRIRSLGRYDGPTMATVNGTATCDGGTGTLTFLTYSTTTNSYVLAGEIAVACDGTTHEWAATLEGGPFQLGHTYLVRGVLTADGQTIAKTYKVTLQ